MWWNILWTCMSVNLYKRVFVVVCVFVCVHFTGCHWIFYKWAWKRRNINHNEHQWQAILQSFVLISLFHSVVVLFFFVPCFFVCLFRRKEMLWTMWKEQSSEKYVSGWQYRGWQIELFTHRTNGILLSLSVLHSILVGVYVTCDEGTCVFFQHLPSIIFTWCECFGLSDGFLECLCVCMCKSSTTFTILEAYYDDDNQISTSSSFEH